MPRVQARIRSVARALVQIEIWPVAALYLAGGFVQGLLPVTLAVAAFFWALRLLAYGRLTVRTPADGPLALMVLMAPVTLWATAYPQETVPQVALLLANIALYYALVNWAADPRRLRLGVAALAAVGLGLALCAPVTVAWHANKAFLVPSSLYSHLPLLLGDGIHPNDMAAALALLFVALAGLLVFAWRQMRLLDRLAMNGVEMAMLVILLLTQSRGALFGVAAALALMVTLRWRRGWLVLLPVAIAGAFGLHTYSLRVLDVITASNILGSLEIRMGLWAEAIHAIQDFPLTGIGMGTFVQVIPALYLFSPGGMRFGHAHNVFLQVAVDLGIPGLVAWLAIVALVVTTTWELVRQGRLSGNRWTHALGVGLLCSQVALLVHGMVDVAAWRTPLGAMIWVLWGLAMAGRNALGA